MVADFEFKLLLPTMVQGHIWVWNIADSLFVQGKRFFSAKGDSSCPIEEIPPDQKEKGGKQKIKIWQKRLQGIYNSKSIQTL